MQSPIEDSNEIYNIKNLLIEFEATPTSLNTDGKWVAPPTLERINNYFLNPKINSKELKTEGVVVMQKPKSNKLKVYLTLDIQNISCRAKKLQEIFDLSEIQDLINNTPTISRFNRNDLIHDIICSLNGPIEKYEIIGYPKLFLKSALK